MTLSKNIRYLRKKNGWSQEHLADLLGYRNYTTIQKWETGIAEPRFKTVQELAKVFDVGIDELTQLNIENIGYVKLEVVSASSFFAHNININSIKGGIGIA